MRVRSPGQRSVQTRGLLTGSESFEFPKSTGNKLHLAPVLTNSMPPPPQFFVCVFLFCFLCLLGSSELILTLNPNGSISIDMGR